MEGIKSSREEMYVKQLLESCLKKAGEGKSEAPNRYSIGICVSKLRNFKTDFHMIFECFPKTNAIAIRNPPNQPPKQLAWTQEETPGNQQPANESEQVGKNLEQAVSLALYCKDRQDYLFSLKVCSQFKNNTPTLQIRLKDILDHKLSTELALVPMDLFVLDLSQIGVVEEEGMKLMSLFKEKNVQIHIPFIRRDEILKDLEAIVTICKRMIEEYNSKGSTDQMVADLKMSQAIANSITMRLQAQKKQESLYLLIQSLERVGTLYLNCENCVMWLISLKSQATTLRLAQGQVQSSNLFGILRNHPEVTNLKLSCLDVTQLDATSNALNEKVKNLSIEQCSIQSENESSNKHPILTLLSKFPSLEKLKISKCPKLKIPNPECIVKQCLSLKELCIDEEAFNVEKARQNQHK